MNTQKPIITVEEGEALLDMATIRFTLGQSLRSELKSFIRRNYTRADFFRHHVDPVAFEAWLLI